MTLDPRGSDVFEAELLSLAQTDPFVHQLLAHRNSGNIPRDKWFELAVIALARRSEKLTSIIIEDKMLHAVPFVIAKVDFERATGKCPRPGCEKRSGLCETCPER